MNRYYFLFISFFVFALDQTSKFFLKNRLSFGEEKEVFSFFTIVHWQNRGGLWGFMGEASEKVVFLLFIILPFLGVAFLVYLFLQSKDKVDIILISIMLGGALGNITDRIFTGSVTDFLYFHFPDRSWSWPAFNIADATLSTSLLIFLVKTLIKKERKDAPYTG